MTYCRCVLCADRYWEQCNALYAELAAVNEVRKNQDARIGALAQAFTLQREALVDLRKQLEEQQQTRELVERECQQLCAKRNELQAQIAQLQSPEKCNEPLL